MTAAAKARQRLKLRTRARALRRRLSRATSVSDGRGYRRLCARAASDPVVFASFKRHPTYTAILEHVSCHLGRAYLDLALAQTPALAERLDIVRRNDMLGAPRVCDYGEYGSFSPTTLRYLKVLSDLDALFGPLQSRSVVEIGVGYGGQCAVASAFGFRSWTLIDLPEVMRLASRYLDTLEAENVFFADPGTPLGADLLVSNYAFSECARSVQEMYLQTVALRCPRGYMTCNFMDGMSRDELAGRINGSRWMDEVPLSGKGNGILVWGDGVTRGR